MAVFRIKTMNTIAQEGLSLLGDNFHVSADEQAPQGILVRSAKVDVDDYPSLLAVARAGAGVNTITVDKATEKGICVFNTPGANANAVINASMVFNGNQDWTINSGGKIAVNRSGWRRVNT